MPSFDLSSLSVESETPEVAKLRADWDSLRKRFASAVEALPADSLDGTKGQKEWMRVWDGLRVRSLSFLRLGGR
jgi:hypothetical protein